MNENPFEDPQQPPAGPPRTSGKAVASLVLGICSFFFSILTGLPAIILGALALGDIKRNPQVEGKGMAIAGITTGSIGTVMLLGCVALLLPAVQAAREAARRNLSMNNMKQIVLAAHNHESAYKQFPKASGNMRGEGAELSWRVHLLPFLEQQALYDQFHMDEPWDSPHNKTLIDQMPAVYQCPNLVGQPGHTVYLAVTGPNAIFFSDDMGATFQSIRDGSSNTIMFVEADPSEAVPWTKPDDWQCDPNNPTAGLGGIRPGVFLAAFADGSVQAISNDIDPATMHAMTTRNGREVVNR
ncbi:MAG: DUF1559 domain-containing protein [Planctomycetales bacterium]|nr:DUF1559 domain-containing protein [Planctomycetales bacterium]